MRTDTSYTEFFMLKWLLACTLYTLQIWSCNYSKNYILNSMFYCTVLGGKLLEPWLSSARQVYDEGTEMLLSTSKCI
jgi:hypothetical protein